MKQTDWRRGPSSPKMISVNSYSTIGGLNKNFLSSLHNRDTVSSGFGVNYYDTQDPVPSFPGCNPYLGYQGSSNLVLYYSQSPKASTPSPCDRFTLQTGQTSAPAEGIVYSFTKGGSGLSGVTTVNNPELKMLSSASFNVRYFGVSSFAYCTFESIDPDVHAGLGFILLQSPPGSAANSDPFIIDCSQSVYSVVIIDGYGLPSGSVALNVAGGVKGSGGSTVRFLIGSISQSSSTVDSIAGTSAYALFLPTPDEEKRLLGIA